VTPARRVIRVSSPTSPALRCRGLSQLSGFSGGLPLSSGAPSSVRFAPGTPGQRSEMAAHPSSAAHDTMLTGPAPQPVSVASSPFDPSGRGGRIAPRVACRSLVRSALAALIACLAAGVSAGECHFGAPGTTVSIAEHPDAWGEVTIHNRLAYRSRTGPCVLQFDGGEVSVTYDPGPGREPDIFVIEAPEGLRADPDWLLVEDETSVRVLVWPIVEGEGM